MIFLDTNIILRFILKDHSLYSSKAEIIFQKIDKGEIRVFLSWLVIFEVVFVLQNSEGLSKQEISQHLLPILSLENVAFEEKKLLASTFDHYLNKNISLADAYHVSLIKKKNIRKIYSFDKDFDRFSEITRLET